ncbi:MAG: RnfABCDGE type electron transport complex subunit D [Clostridia bacterium]|nr:RnfABCDGE type electron transport complex subunit D [Clostridia bacterium]
MAQRKRIKIENRSYIEYMLMLLAPAIVSWYYYGANALRLLLIGIISSMLFELIAVIVMKRDKQSIFDFSAAFTGAAIAMMLPATASTGLLVAGVAFAILVVKIPFGSVLKVPFVPAAAGMAFLSVCFPQEVFTFPAVGVTTQTIETGTSLAAMLQAGGAQHLNMLRVLSIVSGNVSGPMGTCCAAALIGCCAFFLLLKPKKLCNVIGFLAACAVLALLFPRGSFGRFTSLFMELCAGTLLFSGIFFATDPATSPKHPLLRFVYGAFAGTACMAVRYFGAFEDGSCFGILLANAFWPIVESLLRKIGFYKLIEDSGKKRRQKRKKNETNEEAVLAEQGGELNG